MVGLLGGLALLIAIPASVINGRLQQEVSPGWAYLAVPAIFLAAYLAGIVFARTIGSAASLAAFGALAGAVLAIFHDAAYTPPLLLLAVVLWMTAQGFRGVLNRERVL